MGAKCPTCGREYPEIELELDGLMAVRGARYVRLQPMEMRILGLLWQSYKSHGSDVVSHEAIIRGTTRTVDVRSDRPYRTNISKLRKKLATLGLTVMAVHGRGYRLDVLGEDDAPATSSSDEDGVDPRIRDLM